MMRTTRRTSALIAAGALALGSLGGVAAVAHADDASDTPPAVQPEVAPMTSGYWACVALDHVHVGACLENPLPDPSGLPSVRQVLFDLTGIRV